MTSHDSQSYPEDGQTTLKRSRLSPMLVERAEELLGTSIWLQSMELDEYIPGDAIVDQSTRHLFNRKPVCCKPVACYLCGADAGSKEELLRDHIVPQHMPSLTHLSLRRIEEEYLKRLFYNDAFAGPFVVNGQEVRRGLSSYARHQTHSYPGTGSLNHDVRWQTGCRAGSAVARYAP